MLHWLYEDTGVVNRLRILVSNNGDELSKSIAATK
jgi:hypothetical protein